MVALWARGSDSRPDSCCPGSGNERHCTRDICRGLDKTFKVLSCFQMKDPSKPATSLAGSSSNFLGKQPSEEANTSNIQSQFSACANAAVRGTTQTTSSAIFISLADTHFVSQIVCRLGASTLSPQGRSHRDRLQHLVAAWFFLRGFEDKLETLRAAQLKASSR